MTQSSMTYRDAGVDIDEADALVDDIKRLAAPTQRPETLGAVGGFGALMRIPKGYKDPVLVSGTDGVGTKLRLAIDSERVRGLGVDLVAMCVNDILCLGAEPLFFLDYYATGVLDRKVAADVVAGIADGCTQAGCALIGGETAEMPGMYGSGDFDLAGFAVGVVEADAIVDGRQRVRAGDGLIGLPSSGLHANGYSLVRAILARHGSSMDEMLDGEALGDHLLKPTRIYCAPVRDLLAKVPVHGMAHITGGGLTENVPRFLPEGCGARIDADAWKRPALFDWLAEAGNVDPLEMLRTFNCGIGFVIAVPAERVEDALACLRDAGEAPVVIGAVEESSEQSVRYSA
ncbi:MAG: phosphoribosylformylglycinamidine cyclo-ligase [Algiphilus sp.]|uniref:phosphoribosylformylglycinamidine cyclo-ligase n=1 Tax=Algiphilus sp. TaxID=1872431 RepID=UPI001CA6056E|nr:phosphoribosylformylglycinamidine cyclo-ligase [Algiphilus sp.]MBY8966063.1 phosphoribosylformylglycinamidine cyclo-ligase [Algiphilus acroporae]MCI5062031.1 phosphoribosylformylglycinamidine cyclo-ligase [Algiphilus sp.]MCI5104861.1 phosphoribosylformylglycinamidine cyclo-ligase [Algiphilus sp.]